MKKTKKGKTAQAPDLPHKAEKMHRKDLYKLIAELGTTDYESLYRAANAETHNAKNQIKRMVIGFARDGRVEVLGETGTIRIPPHLLEKARRAAEKAAGKEGAADAAAPLEGSKPLKRPKIRLGEAWTDFSKVAEKYELRTKFPNKVLAEAEAIPKTVGEAEIARRLDLRGKLVVTVDGRDAKDLDDAISLEKTAKGWRLGVHIADVSHYVVPGSKLDSEAVQRGNSYYFVNTVVPMFPEALSNGLCSLNPNEDKLTLSIFMDMDPKAKLLGYEIRETVIRTRYRLNYDEVENYFKGGKVDSKFDDKEFTSTLDDMYTLFKLLYAQRVEGGSIDFDFKEQKLKLDGDDLPVKIWLKDRQDSERLIEEFMLAANKYVAKYLSSKGAAIYRIHEEPSAEKFEAFAQTIMRFGHKLEGLPVADPKALQKLLRDVEDTPQKELVNQLLLRSMSQAKYDTDNLGHFGLGFDFYTHFTSPIRRYADLVVHRLVKQAMNGAEQPLYSPEQLEAISVHISATERVGVESERDYYKMKAVRFMKDKVGNVYEGVITGVMQFGMFVQILDYGLEGMIRFSDLDDYFIYEEGDITARGKRSSTRYTIGDKITVVVLSVNVERGFIDLTLTGQKPSHPKGKGKTAKRGVKAETGKDSKSAAGEKPKRDFKSSGVKDKMKSGEHKRPEEPVFEAKRPTRTDRRPADTEEDYRPASGTGEAAGDRGTETPGTGRPVRRIRTATHRRRRPK